VPVYLSETFYSFYHWPRNGNFCSNHYNATVYTLMADADDSKSGEENTLIARD
jgi:hypothetical protein